MVLAIILIIICVILAIVSVIFLLAFHSVRDKDMLGGLIVMVIMVAILIAILIIAGQKREQSSQKTGQASVVRVASLR